jgi:tetratricopeptide (TPR) repeat protein
MPDAPRRFALIARSLGLALAFLGAPAGAGRLAAAGPPDDFAKVIAASKLRYDVAASGPVAKPVEELHCPPRGIGFRVVRKRDGALDLEIWAPSAASAKGFLEAETLFENHDLAGSAAAYKAALAIDPDYGPGWLYAGDIPFAQKDFAAALADYKKALELDPTLPQSHRFAGDALLKLGRFQEAREEYVKALVYDPSYEGAYQGLEVLGQREGFTVARHELLVPDGMLGVEQGGKVPLALTAEQKPWLPYVLCKAVWRNEPAYRAQRLGPEAQGGYNWTILEETECLTSYLVGNLNATEGEIREALVKANPEAAHVEIPVEQVLAGVPATVRHLKEVADAGMVPGYALFAVLGRRCPVAISLLPAEGRQDLERYIRRFVIVPKAPG